MFLYLLRRDAISGVIFEALWIPILSRWNAVLEQTYGCCVYSSLLVVLLDYPHQLVVLAFWLLHGMRWDCLDPRFRHIPLD